MILFIKKTKIAAIASFMVIWLFVPSNIIATDDSESLQNEHSLSIVEYAQIAASFTGLSALLFLLWQNLLLQRQTRELSKSIKSATFQSVISFYIDINKVLVTDPKVAEAFESLSKKVDGLSEVEKRRLEWLAYWLINFYENSYIQYNFGVIPKSLWRGIEADLLEQIKKPFMKELWASKNYLFSEEFYRYLKTKV